MPTSAWTTWAALASKTVHTPVSITIRKTLYGTTNEGSGTYSFPWTGFSTPVSVRADMGFPLEIVGVEENGVALTQQASLGAVQANPGSWYCDSGASKLYVETTGSVNPDNVIASLVALVTLRVADCALCFAGTPPFWPALNGRQMPSYRDEDYDLVRGGSSYPSGDLTLTNADGRFDYLASRDSGFIWENGTVTFTIGGESLSLSDYLTTAVMQIARPITAGDTEAVLQLRSQQNIADTSLPLHSYRDYFGVWSGGGLFDFKLPISDYMPLFWGDVGPVPLTMVEYSGGASTWSAYDNIAIGRTTVSRVDAYEKSTGNVTESISFTSAMTSPLRGVLISNAYSPDTHLLFAYLSRTDAVSGTLRLPGEVALNILSLIGVPSAKIDTSGFVALDATNPPVVSLYVPGGPFLDVATTGRDLLDEIERSYLVRIAEGPDGLWTLSEFSPSFDLIGADVYRDWDFLKFEQIDDADQHLVAGIRLKFGRSFWPDRSGMLSEVWQEVSTSSTEAAARLGRTEYDEYYTCLAPDTAGGTSSAAATILAARVLWLASTPKRRWRVTVGTRMMAATIGYKFRAIRTRGADADGSFDQMLMVEAMTKSLGTGRVEAVVSDIRGLAMDCPCVAPDGTPDWGSASPDEQDAYAFAHDDTTERVDTADPLTYQQARVF